MRVLILIIPFLYHPDFHENTILSYLCEYINCIFTSAIVFHRKYCLQFLSQTWSVTGLLFHWHNTLQALIRFLSSTDPCNHFTSSKNCISFICCFLFLMLVNSYILFCLLLTLLIPSQEGMRKTCVPSPRLTGSLLLKFLKMLILQV